MFSVESYRGLAHQQSAGRGLALPVRPQVARAAQPAMKRALDIAGAGSLLLLSLPVFLVLALLRAGGWRPGLLRA